MKHQQVSVDVVGMVFTACSYLALAGALWIFLRLVQACFWLPRHFKRQNDVQRILEDKISSYEKYIMECEEKERAMELEGSLDLTDEKGGAKQCLEDTQKWKERRECLDMLKRELKRVRDGGDPYDWDHLLNEEEKQALFGDTDDEEESKDKETKEQEEKKEKSDASEKIDKSELNEKSEKSDKSEKSENSDKCEKSENSEKSETAEEKKDK